jgi:hypothetical protein
MTQVLNNKPPLDLSKLTGLSADDAKEMGVELEFGGEGSTAAIAPPPPLPGHENDPIPPFAAPEMPDLAPAPAVAPKAKKIGVHSRWHHF